MTEGAELFPGPDRDEAERILGRYPQEHRQSAVLPLLDLAQRRHGGWLPAAVVDAVGDYLGMPSMRVRELVTFYSMFHDRPVGRYLVQVCRTTPCWLRGSDEVLDAARQELGIAPGETTPDGDFTLIEVECLGACADAPVVQINDDFHERLDGGQMRAWIHAHRGPKEG